MVQYQKSTFNLFHAYRHMVNAQLHLEDALRGVGLRMEAKQYIKTMKTRIDVNVNGLRLKLPDETRKKFEENLLDPEVTLQMQNIDDMLAELPKPIRDQAESYISQLHKVYKQKEQSCLSV